MALPYQFLLLDATCKAEDSQLVLLAVPAPADGEVFAALEQLSGTLVALAGVAAAVAGSAARVSRLTFRHRTVPGGAVPLTVAHACLGPVTATLSLPGELPATVAQQCIHDLLDALHLMHGSPGAMLTRWSSSKAAADETCRAWFRATLALEHPGGDAAAEDVYSSAPRSHVVSGSDMAVAALPPQLQQAADDAVTAVQSGRWAALAALEAELEGVYGVVATALVVHNRTVASLGGREDVRALEIAAALLDGSSGGWSTLHVPCWRLVAADGRRMRFSQCLHQLAQRSASTGMREMPVAEVQAGMTEQPCTVHAHGTREARLCVMAVASVALPGVVLASPHHLQLSSEATAERISRVLRHAMGELMASGALEQLASALEQQVEAGSNRRERAEPVGTAVSEAGSRAAHLDKSESLGAGRSATLAAAVHSRAASVLHGSLPCRAEPVSGAALTRQADEEWWAAGDEAGVDVYEWEGADAALWRDAREAHEGHDPAKLAGPAGEPRYAEGARPVCGTAACALQVQGQEVEVHCRVDSGGLRVACLPGTAHVGSPEALDVLR